jgi:predicted O-methyltransferase YrrM
VRGNRERTVHDTAELLRLLKVDALELYRDEFSCLAKDGDLLSGEDWSTEPELLEVFYCWVRASRPHTIVEVGTYKGTSATVLASALEKSGFGHLYTIDNDLSSALVESRREKVERLNVGSRVTFISKASTEAFADWGRAKIDFLYIDGSHSFVDACLDLALWPRYVPVGGLIAVHDTMTRLLRRFPDDYVYPMSHYDVLHITDMAVRPSGHEWEGCGFLRPIGC